MTSTKKILHMHFGLDGGAERFFVNLTQAFGERGIEQRFVTRPNRRWHSEIADLGPIMTTNMRRLSPLTPLVQWQVHRMVRKWKPDVIMAWMSRASRMMPDYPGAVKLTRLGDYPRHLKNFQNNDLIVTITPDMADKCRALGWDRPVEVVALFARQIELAPVSRAELDTPEDAFLIAGSGRFIKRKGFDTLIRAAAKVPDAWLWLAGAGELESDLKALVAEVGMTDRTRFTGWVDEAMNYVAAADCFGMASRHEPLGNVIFEAWYTGTPAVLTRAEGPSWCATDEVDALMVDIDDVEAMAAAITRVKDEPGLAKRLGDNGRKTLDTRFSRDAIVDQYLAIFDGAF